MYWSSQLYVTSVNVKVFIQLPIFKIFSESAVGAARFVHHFTVHFDTLCIIADNPLYEFHPFLIMSYLSCTLLFWGAHRNNVSKMFELINISFKTLEH